MKTVTIRLKHFACNNRHEMNAIGITFYFTSIYTAETNDYKHFFVKTAKGNFMFYKNEISIINTLEIKERGAMEKQN